MMAQRKLLVLHRKLRFDDLNIVSKFHVD